MSPSSDFDNTMEFVNTVRARKKLPALPGLPEATGTLASQRPLALALGCSVFKHPENGPLYALTRDPNLAQILTKLGGIQKDKEYEATRERKQFIYEIFLPKYMYDHAS